MSAERLAYLRTFHPISQVDYDLLCESCKTRNYKKGDIILSPGQIQRELYFVKSGVQMSIFESAKKSHVIAFTYSPNLCANPESLSFQIPSKYTVQCLSDSELEYITDNELQRLFNQSPGIERLFRKMAEAILSGMINRHIELHSLTIEERYKIFCQRSPHLLQLVPHKYLAAYLGINPTNFSKLFNSVKF